MFLSYHNLSEILFLDIETVALEESYSDLSENLKVYWKKKATRFIRNENITEEEVSNLYLSKAGIFAEFSKIICISVGFLTIKKEDVKKLRIKSFYGEDEAALLAEFRILLNEHFNKPRKHFLCGHNLREFDIPFICRRMLVHEMELPDLLKLSGKRPWQIEHLLDTLDLWRFGDFKHYVSLGLLAEILRVPTPKDDIDGSDIHQVYWSARDMKRIVNYCEKDVITVSKLLLKLNRIYGKDDFDIESTTDII
jgi:uncharacterized protein YprB with RNaseH-like and TPR domain